MKIKSLLWGVFAALMLLCFITRSESMILGASKGLLICSEIVIPSLFPFAALTLFLFNCGVLKHVEKVISPISKPLFGLSGKCFCIMLMSFLGGFPVGAKLINELVREKSISRNTALRMLSYSVNPGPAFVIIGIGQTLLNSTVAGTIIYFSGVISSLLMCIMLSPKERRETEIIDPTKVQNMNIADTFVSSVSDACTAVIGICSFVIFFSTVIGITEELFQRTQLTDILLSLLEISNGTVLMKGNIFILSFLVSFSGFCVHMQVLSVCKSFKVNYLYFLLQRIVVGLMSTGITFVLLKIFRITVPAVSLNSDLADNISVISLPLSAALIFMSITLLISLKQNNVEKC